MSDFKIKSALKSTKVLLAEDDELMLTLIRDVLKIMGFGEITIAKDGKQAFHEVLNNHYDLIFCDWRMPDVSGIDFTRAVRRISNYEKCATPIIMVTGKATIEDVQAARDAGVNEYLAKPFSVTLMCNKVQSVIENPRKFVLSDTYAGPDRRRKNEPHKIPSGIDRRSLLEAIAIG